ncbi:MAG: Ig-like domain-containing protein [Clostridia bacterium]|nr:Ig-like domain-containing protein [Clostridia bacterium]
MKKLDYKKVLYPAVITVLIVFFVGGVVLGGASVMHMEGSAPPYEPDSPFTALPETPEDAAALLNEALKDALNGKPKLVITSDCAFEGDDITLSAAGGYDALFQKYAGVFSSDDAEEKLEELYNKSYADHERETAFGDTLDTFFGDFHITSADITDVQSTDDCWVCANCGESKNDPFEKCEECELKNTAQKRKRDVISVTVTLNAMPGFFPQRSVGELQDLLNEKGSGLYAVDTVERENPEIRLTFELDRRTGLLRTLIFKVKTHLTASLTPNAQNAAYGEITLNCLFDDDVKYELVWPMVTLRDEEPLRPGKTMTVEPKKTQAIKHDKPEGFPANVRWESSDESVLTVDEEGYVKAGKTPGEAVVTVTAEYGGRVYTDLITVYVRKPVEKLQFNKYDLTLGAGETYALKATVAPRKASVQTVTWYSEDESIARVDENGVVTAVAPGKTVIYALSDDGYFRASCKTEVR